MTKQELEKNKELARLYYMNGDTQKLVAEKTGMSRVTINKWVNEGGWEAMRMAKQITRQELVTKMMQEASKKLEDGGMSCDELSKLSAAVKGIDRQANPVTVIEVMTIYNEWLVTRMQADKELTPELVKTMNRYQDTFIKELVTNKSLYNGY
jgi:hypothetical protein